MSVQIIETDTHVIELEILPDTPGVCRRTAKLRLLSGAPLSDEQWGRVQEQCVRALIGAGCRVYGVGVGDEDEDAR